MLFGQGNPWNGRPTRQPRPQSPLVQQPQQAFAPPQVQWPQQTPDMGYAQQLAQYYASQMPNQQVPGSFQQPQPVAQQPLPPMGGHGGMVGGFDRSAFRDARQDWRSQRPQDRSLVEDWRAARPQRQNFFGQ